MLAKLCIFPRRMSSERLCRSSQMHIQRPAHVPCASSGLDQAFCGGCPSRPKRCQLSSRTLTADEDQDLHSTFCDRTYKFLSANVQMTIS